MLLVVPAADELVAVGVEDEVAAGVLTLLAAGVEVLLLGLVAAPQPAASATAITSGKPRRRTRRVP